MRFRNIVNQVCLGPLAGQLDPLDPLDSINPLEHQTVQPSADKSHAPLAEQNTTANKRLTPRAPANQIATMSSPHQASPTKPLPAAEQRQEAAAEPAPNDLMATPAKSNQGTDILAAFQQHHLALKRFIARFVQNTQDIDDVSQEAFMRAYNTEAKGAEIRQPKSYLFRVAKHVALNHLRQKVTRPTDFLEDIAPSGVLVEGTLEDEVLAQELLSIHCAAIASLPPKRQRVYLMRKVYGMSHKEIARDLSIATSTVEAHLSKAFKQCHVQVKARLSEETLQGPAPKDEDLING